MRRWRLIRIQWRSASCSSCYGQGTVPIKRRPQTATRHDAMAAIFGTHLSVVRITDACRPVWYPRSYLWGSARNGQRRWWRQVIVQANVHGVPHLGANGASKLDSPPLLHPFACPFITLLSRGRQRALARTRALSAGLRVWGSVWRQRGVRKRRRCRLRRCHRRTACEGVLLCNVRTVDLRVRLVVR